MRVSVSAIIACAMEEEIAPFLAQAESVQPVLPPLGPEDFQRFYTAHFAGVPVLLVRSGIGLTNAALAATRALAHVKTPLYLLAGTTGGLSSTIEIGDIVAGTRTLFFEADATAFGYQMGQTPQMPADYTSDLSSLEARVPQSCHAGTVISGNSFITSDSAHVRREQFPEALAVDMETAAVAQVCYLHGVNWMSLRAVSDLCGPQANQDFHMEADRASALSCDAVAEFLQ